MPNWTRALACTAAVICGGCGSAPRVGPAQALGEYHLRAQRPIVALAVDPAGGWAVSGAFGPYAFQNQSGGSLTVWDLETGKPLRHLIAAADLVSEHVSYVDRSADGAQVVAGLTTGEVVVFDRASGEERERFAGHGPARFAADGAVVYVDAHDAKQLRLRRGGEDAELVKLTFEPQALRVHGDAYAAAGEDRLVIGSLAGGAPRPLEGFTGHVQALAFSPDGTLLASGADEPLVRVWNVETGDSSATYDTEGRNPESLAWSPDGARIAWGDAGELREPGKSGHKPVPPRMVIQELATDAGPRVLLGHTGRVGALEFRSTSELVSASWDHSVRRWDVASGLQRVTHNGHQDPVMSVAFSPDGTRLATGGEDRTVRVWELASGRVLHTLEHSRDVRQVVWAGNTLATRCTGEPTVFVWDAERGALGGQPPPGLEAVPLALALDPAGETLFTLTTHGELFVSQVRDGAERGFVHLPTEFHVDSARMALLPGDAQRVVCALRTLTNPIYLVDLERPQEPALLTNLGDGSTVSALALAPGGDFLYAATLQGSCLKFTVPDGKLLWRVEVEQVLSLALSPDGSRLVLGHDNNDPATWLDPETGDVLGHLPSLHNGDVWDLAFSPDGSRLASVGDDNVPLVHELLADD